MSACGATASDRTLVTFYGNVHQKSTPGEPKSFLACQESISRWPSQDSIFPFKVTLFFVSQEESGGEKTKDILTDAQPPQVIVTFPEKEAHIPGPKISKFMNIGTFEWEGVPHFHIEGERDAACIQASNVFNSMTVYLMGERVKKVEGYIDQTFLKSECKDQDNFLFPIHENTCPHLKYPHADRTRVAEPEVDYAIFSYNLGCLAQTSTPNRLPKGLIRNRFLESSPSSLTLSTLDFLETKKRQ